MIYLYIGPARTWVTTYAEAERKRDDVASLRAAERAAARAQARLARAGAVELEARKLGMVKAGEKLYVVE